MRSRVGLCVLALLCLHSSVCGQEAVEIPPGVLIFCDDPSVAKAVSSALDKFNEQMSSGYKLALYQILTASKSENGSDTIYALQFTSRRSDCSVGGTKHWTDCNYLPSGSKKPFSCNATVYVRETQTDTKQVDCMLDDYVVPDRAHCMGCPEDIDEKSEDLKVPLSVSISKYNSISDSTHLFNFHKLGFATRQVVAGFRFQLRYDMRKTICAKAENKELGEHCVPDNENVEFYNCNSTVDVAPWRLEPPSAQIQCEPGPLPNMDFFSRRRPPGWSPLRNVLLASPSPTSPTKAVKDESSEEDTTASGTSGDSPFHCPSKPWKPFKPSKPAAPTKATLELPSPNPAIDGAFSDADLLV
ncbi:kininogen-1 [Aulostomus maculatus]